MSIDVVTTSNIAAKDNSIRLQISFLQKSTRNSARVEKRQRKGAVPESDCYFSSSRVFKIYLFILHSAHAVEKQKCSVYDLRLEFFLTSRSIKELDQIIINRRIGYWKGQQ